MPINVNEALNAAAEAIKIGDLRKAVIYYSAILKKIPDHADANHNLAQIFLPIKDSLVTPLNFLKPQ